MSPTLRKYKRDVTRKLSNGGTVGGRGRLTDAVIDNSQNYYGAAIRNNNNSVNKIKNAIWAIYYHCILCENEPLWEEHYLCPKGSTSWCWFQHDQVEKITIYSQDKCLTPAFRNEIKPFFLPDFLIQSYSRDVQKCKQSNQFFVMEQMPKTCVL